jgi:hypothetical protein
LDGLTFLQHKVLSMVWKLGEDEVLKSFIIMFQMLLLKWGLDDNVSQHNNNNKKQNTHPKFLLERHS